MPAISTKIKRLPAYTDIVLSPSISEAINNGLELRARKINPYFVAVVFDATRIPPIIAQKLLENFRY